VHLVGHSLGGLSVRYYIKILGGLPHVASYTAFGTPQHGNPDGCFSPLSSVYPARSCSASTVVTTHPARFTTPPSPAGRHTAKKPTAAGTHLIMASAYQLSTGDRMPPNRATR
jgi:hypothetical protein